MKGQYAVIAVAGGIMSMGNALHARLITRAVNVAPAAIGPRSIAKSESVTPALCRVTAYARAKGSRCDALVESLPVPGLIAVVQKRWVTDAGMALVNRAMVMVEGVAEMKRMDAAAEGGVVAVTATVAWAGHVGTSNVPENQEVKMGLCGIVASAVVRRVPMQARHLTAIRDQGTTARNVDGVERQKLCSDRLVMCRHVLSKPEIDGKWRREESGKRRASISSVLKRQMDYKHR
jgi:hypothetical protein